jgi:uncharacterized RDD family membrane protein YckC
MPQGPHHFPAHGPDALASFAQRAGARALDSLLIGVPVLMVAAATLDLANPNEHQQFPWWASLAWFLLAITYEVAMLAWRGQTLGKLAVGIRVARLDNGKKPLWWQAAIRFMVPGVWAALPFQYALVVYFAEHTTGFWDATRRAIHDRAAGTVVVTTK